MNDTKATRIGMYNGLFFQFIVCAFSFGVFVIIFLLSYNWMQYYVQIDGAVIGLGIGTMWFYYLLKVSERFAAQEAPKGE